MGSDKIKELLGTKEYEVNVITSADSDRKNGQIATWVTQVSSQPPLLAVCIAPTRYTNELISRSGVLAINILTRDQVSLVAHFGYQSGRDIDKFATVDHTIGATGCPIINGASAYLECEVKTTYPGGDHLIHVAEVLGGDILSGGPRLLYQWMISKNKRS